MSRPTPPLYTIRNWAYRALGPTSRRRYPRPMWILMYHSVGDNGFNFTVTPEDFRRQIEHCRARFDIVPLERLAAVARGEPLPGERPAVALTFDDCYADNLDQVVPLLRDAKAPATFYAATGTLGGQMPTRYGALPLMAWSDVESLARAGFELGAHTVSHKPLTRMEPAERQRELADSKKQLEDRIGRPVISFAYPYGTYDAGCIDQTGQAGFTNAVTTREGMIRPGVSPLELPRIPMLRWVDFPVFVAMLDGAIEAWERLRGR